MMSEVNEETLRAREALAGHYKEVLGLLGEDVEREGLLKNARTCGESDAVFNQGDIMRTRRRCSVPPCFRKRITNRWLS